MSTYTDKTTPTRTSTSTYTGYFRREFSQAYNTTWYMMSKLRLKNTTEFTASRRHKLDFDTFNGFMVSLFNAEALLDGARAILDDPTSIEIVNNVPELEAGETGALMQFVRKMREVDRINDRVLDEVTRLAPKEDWE